MYVNSAYFGTTEMYKIHKVIKRNKTGHKDMYLCHSVKQIIFLCWRLNYLLITT